MDFELKIDVVKYLRLFMTVMRPQEMLLKFYRALILDKAYDQPTVQPRTRHNFVNLANNRILEWGKTRVQQFRTAC